MRFLLRPLLTLPLLVVALARPAPAAEPTFRTEIPGDEDSALVMALAGRTLVVADSDGPSTTWLLDARTGATRAVLSCPIDDPYFGEVCGVSVAASRDRVAVGGTSFVLVYDRAGRLLHELRGDHPDWARFGASVSLHGKRLLVGIPEAPDGGAAQLFDVRTGRPLRTFTDPEPTATGFGGKVLLRGGRAFVIAASPAGPRLSAFDVATGAPLWSVTDAGGFSELAAVDHDVVVLSHAGEPRRLDGDTGATVVTYVVPNDAFPDRRSLAAGGRTVAIGDPSFGEHGGVHLFDARTGVLRETVEPTEPTGERVGRETVLDGTRFVTRSSPDGGALLLGFRR